jgi:hypothetical protein
MTGVDAMTPQNEEIDIAAKNILRRRETERQSDACARGHKTRSI